MSYGAVSVTSSPTLILAANNERKGCLIANNAASASIYLGLDASVSTSNGIPLASGATLNNSGVYDAWRGAIYAIVTTGTADVRFWEWS